MLRKVTGTRKYENVEFYFLGIQINPKIIQKNLPESISINQAKVSQKITVASLDSLYYNDITSA